MNPLLILARIVLPLLILINPLVGGGISIALDNLDWHTKYLFGINPIGDYQTIDKFLDLYYFSLLAVFAWKFKNHFMRNVIIGLFLFRVVGIVLFEVTQIRALLFFFPNIFENLFFLYYIIKSIATYEPKISYRMFGLLLLLVTIPKMMHEYSIHIIQKQLLIHIFGYPYAYEGTFHQIIFIGVVALLFGMYYRKQKKASIPK
jgi:hypothetical protein